MDTSSNNKLFHKDFTLVLIGQIISLFGNAILRFALPLYLLDQTQSAALFGLVSACAFIPMILLSPIGGIVADRINKQRIMVALDFTTAALVFGFSLFRAQLPLVPLLVVVMMLLYGIQGAYQPAVQASLPALVAPEKLIAANAAVNQVNSLAGLLGPVIGGFLYGTYGLTPILSVSIVCFALSAVMELFIRIPHQKRRASTSVWAIVREDMRESFHFILREKPVLAKGILIVCAFNLFMSSMLIIGMPVIITQHLGMSSQLYGASQGALAAGGLLGGLLAGLLGERLKITHAHILLLFCALGCLPIGIILAVSVSPFFSYLSITVLVFLLMMGATLFTVQMLAFVQKETPQALIGKVIACLLALNLCAQPIGQALYGVLFERFAAAPWAIVIGTALISCIVALLSKKVFSVLKEGQSAPPAEDGEAG